MRKVTAPRRGARYEPRCGAVRSCSGRGMPAVGQRWSETESLSEPGGSTQSPTEGRDHVAESEGERVDGSLFGTAVLGGKGALG